METEDRSFVKLNDEDLEQLAGGQDGTLLGKAYAPKITCSMCLIHPKDGKHRAVEMSYDGIYHVYGTDEYGYCYVCPECGFKYKYKLGD